VIEARDVDNIYAVPEPITLPASTTKCWRVRHRGANSPALQSWHVINERVRNPEGAVTIAIVGKYTG